MEIVLTIIFGIAGGIVGILGVYFAYLQWKETRKQTELTEKSSQFHVNPTKSIDTNSISEIEEIKQPKIEEVIKIPESNIPSEIDKSGYREKPFPHEISKAIQEAPPFMERNIAQNYEGLKVKWEMGFYNIERDEGTIYAIHLFTEEGGVSAWFSVDIARYPELKIMKKKHKIRVYGEIEKIYQQTVIYLKNCYLEYDSEV